MFLGLLLHESEEPLQTLKEARRVARVSICILEWPYLKQPFGLPIDHRINPEFLCKLFRKAGFRKWELVELTNTVFYWLEG